MAALTPASPADLPPLRALVADDPSWRYPAGGLAREGVAHLRVWLTAGPEPRGSAAGRQEHADPGQFLDEPAYVGVHLLVWRSTATVDSHQEPHNETSEINPAAMSA